jgi:hypothetical protein
MFAVGRNCYLQSFSIVLSPIFNRFALPKSNDVEQILHFAQSSVAYLTFADSFLIINY